MAGASGNGGAAVKGTPLTGVTAVSAGTSHACALLKGGGVVCWGENAEGQLGNGSTTNSTVAVPVSGIANATAIAVGFDFSCAVLADGTARCWGDNSQYELGSDLNGTTYTTPIPVYGLTGATMVAASEYTACAVVSGGLVRCWGANGNLELSVVDAAVDLGVNVPMTLANISGVTAISASDGLCVIVAGGQVQCWGENLAPSVVKGVTASAISGNCALLPDGNIQCWQNLTFVPVDAGTLGPGGFTSFSVSSAGSNLCAVQGATGTAVYCAGRLDPLGPESVSGLTGVSSVSAGFDFACAAMNDGTAQCWGDNESGELGNGMIQTSAGPVTVLVPQ